MASSVPLRPEVATANSSPNRFESVGNVSGFGFAREFPLACGLVVESRAPVTKSIVDPTFGDLVDLSFGTNGLGVAIDSVRVSRTARYDLDNYTMSTAVLMPDGYTVVQIDFDEYEALAANEESGALTFDAVIDDATVLTQSGITSTECASQTVCWPLPSR
jgi:hypothetical protein